MTIVYTFVAAMFLSMVLIPPLVRVAGRLNLMDMPFQRKVHASPIPRIGGIAIVVGTAFPVLAFVSLRQDVVGFLMGAAVLLVFGVWDDGRDLDYRVKFLGQLLAALVVVFYGGVVVERFPFVPEGRLPDYICVPFTVLALVGITNAINLADGLDGLAGGTSLLVISCMGVLAYGAGDVELALTSAALVGAILGFLRYNSYPARIFMGDAGSQFLGFSAAVLAIILTQSSYPSVSPALPLLLLGWPILDTLGVIGQRISESRSPFEADRNHTHHKLMALGFDHYQAVLLIYVAQAALVTGAYFLRHEADYLIVGLYAVFGALVLGGFHWALVSGWQLHDNAGSKSGLAKAVQYLRRKGWLVRVPYGYSRLAVPFILLMGALTAEQVPWDFGVVAAALFVTLVVAILWREMAFSLVEQTVVYVTVAFVVYLIAVYPGVLDRFGPYVDLLFLALAVAVASVIRFSLGGVFRTSPLDFLVVFMALLIANLPELASMTERNGAIVIKVIILWYASEMLMSRAERNWGVLRYGTLGTLLVLGARGLM